MYLKSTTFPFNYYKLILGLSNPYIFCDIVLRHLEFAIFPPDKGLSHYHTKLQTK